MRSKSLGAGGHDWQERIFLREIFALFAASRWILGWTFTAKARSTRGKREGL